MPVKGFSQLMSALNEELQAEGVKTYEEADLHCTIMYSKEEAPHSIRVTKLLNAGPFTFKAWSDKLSYWPGHDNAGYLVLQLNSRDLAIRHEQYVDLGCQHSFPDYEAHITLADKIGDKPKCFAKLNRMLSSLKFEITLTGEQVEDIKD
jgi:2'-5' RNA ligase